MTGNLTNAPALVPTNQSKCYDGSMICNDKILIDILGAVMGGEMKDNGVKSKDISKENIFNSNDSENIDGGKVKNKNRNKTNEDCQPCKLLAMKVLNNSNISNNSISGGKPSDIVGEPNVIYEEVKSDDKNALIALDVLTDKFKCPKGDESCVIKEAKKRNIIDNQTKEEALSAIKEDGPLDGEWLNNENIYNVLEGWQTFNKKFYPIGYAMRDFEKHPDDYELSYIDPVAKVNEGFNCFGCVCNTDVHSGGGIHWVAMFVDLRDNNKWTAEFFNSTGRPYREFIAGIEKMAKKLRDAFPDKDIQALNVTEVEHQESDSECGLYSLYYIYFRLLLNKPYGLFNKVKFRDIDMFTFRKSIFANGVDEKIRLKILEQKTKEAKESKVLNNYS